MPMSAIVPPEKRRKPGPAKGTRPAGRKLGTKNKATVARELQAAQQILQAQSKDHESALAVLSRLLADLDRFKQLAEGAASYHRPPTAEELAAAQEAEDAIAEQEGREARTVSAGDWGLFGQWFDRTVSTAQAAAVVAKELAKYQAPQIKAVDAPAPPPDIKAEGVMPKKRFTLTIFEGDRQVAQAEVEPRAANG